MEGRKGNGGWRSLVTFQAMGLSENLEELGDIRGALQPLQEMAVSLGVNPADGSNHSLS